MRSNGYKTSAVVREAGKIERQSINSIVAGDIALEDGVLGSAVPIKVNDGSFPL